MRHEANTAWFTLTLNGRKDFAVYSFSGQEAVCTPYEFRVEVVHPSADENLSAFIGSPALLRIADRSGKSRHVHGLVREMHRLRRGNHLTHYEPHRPPPLVSWPDAQSSHIPEQERIRDHYSPSGRLPFHRKILCETYR